ncbi:MAG: nucleoside-diphosphate-sugar epimerase [Porticoccus sp.]|jgi:nucleoside-diphosphate-sugar epimerase
MDSIENLTVLVTGASGFVGKVLCQKLLDSGVNLSVLTRRPLELDPHARQHVFKGLEAIQPQPQWFDGVDIVVHLAARVHQMQADPENETALQMAENCDATVKLASMAAKCGVKQFIYLSSIKVNGEHTDGREPFSELDIPAPKDAYGLAKWDAEQGLNILAGNSDLAITIIRPPLVYGPDVKANFKALLRLSIKGLPLPLASINNTRSLVSVDNLAAFIIHCCSNKKAFNQTFLVADSLPVSTPQLVRLMALSQGKSACLLPVPIFILKAIAWVLNRRTIVERLVQSLEVSCAKAERLLGWLPPAETVIEFKRYSAKWSS